ncbi:hypothetical protein BD770DRAFT_343811 [Pilaira anomala]|nr:hypothetical protein BD770DRAFT_343811 [Pilaira anomala]
MSFVKSFCNLTIKRSYNIKSLHPKKFVSILHEVPVKPRNPWQIYLRENMDSVKDSYGVFRLKEAAGTLAAQWKGLSDAEKKKYQEMFAKELEEHNTKMQEVLSTTTPKQFREENLLRQQYNLEPVRDPNQPKRPLNRFLFYVKHLRATNDPALRDLDPKEQVSVAAKKFKTLDENEAKVFTDQAEVARQEYVEAKKAYDATAI